MKGRPKETKKEATERRLREAAARAAVMRKHPFEGSGPYCQRWDHSDRSTESGTVGMGVRCGYPADMHPGKQG